MKLILGKDPFTYQLDFTVPDVDNVGLFLSGGMDSTALLCLIIEELNRTNRQDLPIHIWTCTKPPDTEHAPRMASAVSIEYDREFIYHENYPTSDRNKNQGLIDIDCVYDAYQQFDSIVMYMAGNNSWEKTPWAHLLDIQNQKLPWHYPEYDHITYPFLNLLKMHLVDIYYKLGKEHFIAYTYSCSNGAPPPACHRCYSCREAATGFKMLGKVRPDYIPIG